MTMIWRAPIVGDRHGDIRITAGVVEPIAILYG
jgi:hypothetical protein